jgi:phosphatidylglycerophosphate synthase
MVAIALLLFVLAPAGHGGEPGPVATAGSWVYWLAVFLTIASGLQYVLAAKDLFREET